jgi:hypothetical protein
MLYNKFGVNRSSVTVNALWDTGATASCISKALAEKIGLISVGRRKLKGISEIYKANEYIIDLNLNNGVVINNARVAEFLNCDNFDVIIGMDIITLGDLSITNSNNKTVVSFRIPSDTYHIDYVEMSKKSKLGKAILDRLKRTQTRKHN